MIRFLIPYYQTLVHGLARRKGFYDDVTDPADPVWLSNRIALVHSELSEALECIRKGQMNTEINENGKPEGFPSELADVMIRLLDLAESVGIDLEAEIAVKHAYNESRPHMHGGKAL